ncbi:MAG: NADH-quinone oxidoreductase subunit M [Chloroflexi bacterium]|nr:NADH-quinone oxidoreductase subunit M [Chloroflexota bacterium]
MTFPVLSIIVFTPIVVGMLLLLFPAERKSEIRVAALAAAAICLGLSLFVYFSYNTAAGGYQFVEKFDWVPDFGISYHMGVDGISLPLVLLTGIVIFTGVLISWGMDDRPREFFAFLFILATGVFGTFVSLDLFQLFFFYEIAVFPMFLLIAIWGWQQTREYAAMKLTLYLFIGSVIALVGALAMYFTIGRQTGVYTFDMLKMSELQQSGALNLNITINSPFTGAVWINQPFEIVWFPFVFLGFAVLAGIWPFHNWSPDGHVAAPTAVSMFHAGVLMKLGAFAALRVGIMLLPEGAKFWMPAFVFLTVVNVVYGAFIAMVQKDFKYVIGFSSVSHMGLVSMGFATLNRVGYIGATLQMFSHGVMTALFFAVVGMVYDRAHTRNIPDLGGFVKKMPWAAVAFIIGGFVSMGMPGFSGFIAELPIFLGLWQAREIAPYYVVIAVLSATAIVVTACYVLRVVQNVFFGEFDEHKYHDGIADVTVLDKTAIVVLCSVLILLGVFPALMYPLVSSGVDSIMRLLGVA